MNPIIPIWLIYLAGVCDDLKGLFYWVGGLGIVVLLFTGAMYYDSEGEPLPHFKKYFLSLLLCFFIAVIVPTQKTVYTIIVGSQITPKNIELVGGTVKSTMDYMFDKTEKLIQDVKK